MVSWPVAYNSLSLGSRCQSWADHDNCDVAIGVVAQAEVGLWLKRALGLVAQDLENYIIGSVE